MTRTAAVANRGEFVHDMSGVSSRSRPSLKEPPLMMMRAMTMRAATDSALLLTPANMIMTAQQGTRLNMNMGTRTKNANASMTRTSKKKMGKKKMSKKKMSASTGTSLVTDHREAIMITDDDCMTMSTRSRTW